MTYSLSDKRQLLSNNLFFKNIPANELNDILTFSSDKGYRKGQIIFQQGDPGDSLLAVLDGKISISNSNDEGKEIILNTIYKGEVFGEIAFIDGMSRSATATAIDESTLLTIRRNDFIPYLKTRPEITLQWLTILCNKLRDTSERVEAVGLLPVPISLARLLLRSANSFGGKTSAGWHIDWNKSQREIGNEIGTSRETINKQFSQWKKDGLIIMGGADLSITIVDIELLKMIADGSM